jgi:hypothetical protein
LILRKKGYYIVQILYASVRIRARCPVFVRTVCANDQVTAKKNKYTW